jgi:hypothetical protein
MLEYGIIKTFSRELLLNEWLIFDNGIITACCCELFLGGSFWKM